MVGTVYVHVEQIEHVPAVGTAVDTELVLEDDGVTLVQLGRREGQAASVAGHPLGADLRGRVRQSLRHLQQTSDESFARLVLRSWPRSSEAVNVAKPHWVGG